MMNISGKGPRLIEEKRVILHFAMPVFIFLFITCPLSSQDNTLYFIHSIPQANQLNPAVMFPCKVYVGLPVISSVKLNIRNTGFGFHDAVHTGTGVGSDTFYLDLPNLDKKLKRMNYFRADADIDLLGFGFYIKDWFLTFGIVNHTEVRVAYPHDVVSVRDGNWLVEEQQPNPLRFSGLGVDAINWNSIGISVAKEVREGLRAGVRLKYLQGVANVNTRRSKLVLTTNPDPISLEAEAIYRLNAAFPVQLGYAANGLVDSVSFEDSFNNIPGDFIFNGNHGVSVDAGAIYDLDENTQISLSFVDLGFIRWRKNVNNFNADGKYTFSGIDLDQYQQNPNPDEFLQALEDSLMQAWHAAGTMRKYFTATSLKILGGITREIRPDLKAGVMTRTEIYDLRIRPSLTFSLNYAPFRALATSLSYTIMNNKLNQIGAGIAIGCPGAQFYLLTDNIPVRFTRYSGSPVIWPYNARMISLRFGLNLVFGCREKQEKQAGSGNRRRQRPGSSDLCPAYW